MPILAAEPDVFPEHLLDPGFAPADGAWWVVQTKPRQEKALARRLAAAGIAFFAPVAAKRSAVRGRIRTAMLPVFPGYVFARGADADRVKVLATGRVVRVLAVPDQAGLWTDLRQVRRVITSGGPVFPEDRIAPGSLVKVTAGPLAGLTGTVVRNGTARRFVVRVEFLRRGVAVELDDAFLARLAAG